MAAANILNLLSENNAIHLPILKIILSERLFYLLTLIYLVQYGHFQLVLGNEYPNMRRMMLNFQLRKMSPTSRIKRIMC